MKKSELRQLIREEISKVLNEASNNEIEIISMTDAGISNTNRTQSTKNFKEIKAYLLNPDQWTDDVSFRGKKGERYFIDDLIGQRVRLGGEVMSVEE
jgi:hypothetical protein